MARPCTPTEHDVGIAATTWQGLQRDSFYL